MGKSRRFHKRVHKRHTRKHKPTRKKNKMKKNYSRKQRGGNPVSIAIGGVLMLAVGALLVNLANEPDEGKRTIHTTNRMSYRSDTMGDDVKSDKPVKPYMAEPFEPFIAEPFEPFIAEPFEPLVPVSEGHDFNTLPRE
jgi:hypothetical protein